MKNKIIKLITIAVIALGFTRLAQASQPTSADCPTTTDYQCCVVANTQNPTPDETGTDYPDSLHSKVQYFNASGTQSRKCRDKISFTDDATRVHIYENFVFDEVDNSHEFHLGNSEGQTVTFIIHDTVDPALPIITIKNLPDTTIENLIIETADDDGDVSKGFRGTFIRIEESDTVEIRNIQINNKPYKSSIEISNSSNVSINEVHVQSTSLDPATGLPAPVISVADSSDHFSFSNTGTNEFEEIAGNAIEIDGSNDFSIKDLTVKYNSAEASSSSVGIFINDSKCDSECVLENITISDTLGTGIKFSGVNGERMTMTGIDLTGHTSLNNANGMIIEDSQYLSFDGSNVNLSVTYFGQNGILISGNSHNNTIKGNGYTYDDTESSEIYIAEIGKNTSSTAVHGDMSAGHGILVEGTATGEPYDNSITLSAITHNLNCGIYLKSEEPNIARQNNYVLDDECGISGEGYVTKFTQSDFTLITRGQSSLLFDYDRTSFEGMILAGFELHAIRSLDDADEGSTSGINLRSKTSIKTNHVSLKSGTANSGSTNGLELEGTGSSSSGAQLKGESGSSSYSLLGSYEYDENTYLLADEVPANPESVFFVLIYNDSGYVIGVANDLRAMTDYADLDNGCYTDPDNGTAYRLEDLEADYDDDDLFDYLEDTDMDCVTDAGETSVYDEDTDDDLINDYLETYFGYDPLSKYSAPDTDGLTDGEEDLDQDGELDDGETDPLLTDTDDDGSSDSEEITNRTDPRNPDTDDDGLLDGAAEELCPHISSTEECYYEDCIPSDEFISGSVSTGGDDTSGEECIDSDDDDLCDSLEDADGSCSITVGETIVGLKDTDGDGIKDGDEDYNHDGVYDSGTETNPVEEDSDGDCIPDGLEDANFNHFVDDITESDPTLSDTDGDGISDGTEDFNCDGDVGTGETNPNMTDTDGDGLLDSSPDMDFTDSSVTDVYDIAPWEYGPENNYVVRYCGLNGWDDYDYDGDGLSDVSEDNDGDCINDIDEPSPLDTDSDDDGVTDYQELNCGYGGSGGEGTDPRNPDTDGDGMTDYEEAENTILAGECGSLFQALGDGDTWGAKSNASGCSINTARNVATSGSNLPIMMLAGVVMFLVVRRMRHFA